MMKTNVEVAIEKLEKFINHGKEKLEEAEKEDFYSLGLDTDGMPYSFGNADDVYSDGYDAGTYAGKSHLAKIILDILKGENNEG